MSNEDVRVLKIEPGDVVVLETQNPVSAEQAALIKASFKDRMPELADRKILVLGGMQFKVVRLAARETTDVLGRIAGGVIPPSEMR